MPTPSDTEALAALTEKLAEMLFDALPINLIEEWLYSCPYLETTLSSDDYLTVIEVDYRAAGSKDTLIGVLLSYVDAADLHDEQAKRLFLEAGWFEGRRLENLDDYRDMPPHQRESIDKTRKSPAFPHALAILSEYGRLAVGTAGSGVECGGTDIKFCDRPGMATDAWEREFGTLIRIATAHRDHITVYVGPDGQVYFYTDPDDCLYLAGQPATAFTKLLVGLDYGKPVWQG